MVQSKEHGNLILIQLFTQRVYSAGLMAQQVAALAARHEHLSLTPPPLMGEGKKESYRMFSGLHTCTMAHTHSTHKHICIYTISK